MRKIQNLFWILLPLALVGYLIYKIAINSFTDHFLGSNPQHIRAVIIDNKNFMGNHPVDPLFSYSYAFKINGTQYTGDSHDITLKIGDTVEVEYNKDHPGINKPLRPKN